MPTLPTSGQSIAEIFEPVYRQANKVCLSILGMHLLLAFIMAPYYSTWFMALCVGVPAVLLPLVLWRTMPLARLTRMTVGLAFQTFTALHIYQMHGLMEMHFFFFTAVTAMIVYQDLLAIVPGTAAIVLQHIVFAYLTNRGVNLYFFHDDHIGLLKLTYHFGIAIVQVGLAGWAIVYLRSRTLEMAEVLAQVRETAQQLASSSSLVRAESGSLDSGVHQQAASLQTTAASVEEISATLKQTADNTRLAAELSTAASQLASEGDAALSESSEQIVQLERSSREICGLVDSLEELALQTKFLSYNAAIEAAHAGENGLSFAVVAGEVGRLAERSTSAARAAAALIGTSVQRIQSSAHSVARSATVLRTLVDNSSKVSETVTEISSAAVEQAEAIQEIKRSIEALDRSCTRSGDSSSRLMDAAETLDLATQALQTLLARSAEDRDGGTAERAPAVAARLAA